jgi:protein-S-isoprenylcysteine O-methyltransferase Ste14
MTQPKVPNIGVGSRAAATGAIFLFFIVALEIVIMISPFAFFFYALFNPFLLALNQSPVTRWLTAFFLPHMIVPPNAALKILRILGSVFFVGGALLFLICAGQVYLGKLLKKRVATGAFYRLIRHPQYLGLGLAALGLVIMWPRFLNLGLFALMLFLYYLLAKDEERRMIKRFGESYLAYMKRTGMFFPNFIEKVRMRNAKPPQPLQVRKAGAIFLVLLPVIIGSGFILRSYTIRHLPLEEVNGVDVITITNGDLLPAKHLLPAVIGDSAVGPKLQSIPNDKDHRVLAYFIPVDYVMQGMIADTGKEWKLFEQHKTIGMITGYIFHPFAHLTEGHTGLMTAMHHQPIGHDGSAMRRRIIFMEISAGNRELQSPYDDFGINIKRTPLFFVDLNLHPVEILRVQEMPGGSGWGHVPTPMF